MLRSKNLIRKNIRIFVVNRLLEKGNIEAVRFVLKTFPKDEIIETFKKLIDFNKKTAYFWSLFLEVPQNQIKSLDLSYLKMCMRYCLY